MKQAMAHSDTTVRRFLTVIVGGRPYGINVEQVVEAATVPQVTPLPQSPDHIIGVFSYRGSIIALSDLRTRFGCIPTNAAAGCVVIVDIDDPYTADRFRIGIMVDEVGDIVEFQPDAIELPPSLGSIMSTNFVFGLGRTEDDAMLLLNISETITVEEIELMDGFNDQVDAYLHEYSNGEGARTEQTA